MPPMEPFFLHLCYRLFLVPVLDDDPVDGANGAGPVSTMKAVDKNRAVGGIEEDLEKIDHDPILRLVGVKGDVNRSDLVTVISFYYPLIKILCPEIYDGFDPIFCELLEARIGWLPSSEEDSVHSMEVGNAIAEELLTDIKKENFEDPASHCQNVEARIGNDLKETF